MNTPSSALQPQLTSPPPLESQHQAALGTRAGIATELNPDQLADRATTTSPQLLALLAETGRSESGLND